MCGDLLYLYFLAKTASTPCWRKWKQGIGNGHDTTRNVQKVRRSNTEVSNFIPYIAELTAIYKGSTIWSTINVIAFHILHLLVHWMELIQKIQSKMLTAMVPLYLQERTWLPWLKKMLHFLHLKIGSNFSISSENSPATSRLTRNACEIASEMHTKHWHCRTTNLNS